MARKPKPEEPDKFNTPKPHDLPEDGTPIPPTRAGRMVPAASPSRRRTEKP